MTLMPTFTSDKILKALWKGQKKGCNIGIRKNN